MKQKLLDLIPKRYFCPQCGEWHNWKLSHKLSYYNSASSKVQLACENYDSDYTLMEISFYDGYCYYRTFPTCRRGNLDINKKISIEDIVESSEEPRVTFSVPFKPSNEVGKSACRQCCDVDRCLMCRLADENESQYMHITFGFEFEQSDYDKIVKTGQSVCEKCQMKEESFMAEAATKRTSIRSMLYEKSPKENIETMKAWAEKYKPVLQWAIPMAAVYGAYRILNSDEYDLSVNNISEICEKKLGFKVKALENKKALKELMVIGGLSAGAYGAVKAISGIFGQKEEKDISVEEVENGMSTLESMSKKFAWIQPKTEDMLPVAFSVIFVYVTLHKPKFLKQVQKKISVLTGDFQIKVNTYIELAKLFIQDKFNIDLDDEEEQKKLKICAFLIALCGVFVFLYGKRVLGSKKGKEESEPDKEEINESVVAFIEQAKIIIEKIAPTVYTTLVTMLVSKKLLMQEDVPELPAGEDENESPEENESSDTNNEE